MPAKEKNEKFVPVKTVWNLLALKDDSGVCLFGLVCGQARVSTAHQTSNFSSLKGSVSRDFLGPFLACMDRSRSV